MLVATLALAALALASVLGTVFFAVTVAYLLAPVRGWLVDRGLSRWTASLAATTLAFVAALAAFTPLVVVAAIRLDQVLALVAALPETFPVDVAGFEYVVTLAEIRAVVIALLRDLAAVLLGALPVLSLKFTVFALLVFSLVYNQAAARRSVVGVVPPAYRDVAEAFDRRIRATLFAIYVLQAATAAATFLVALAFFVAFGYTVPVTLAVVAGVLQFVPVLGPSLLLLGIAAFHLAAGDVSAALIALLGGGVLIAWLPDVLVRPRLARETTGLPGSLYFVGFVGGLLSLGPVGVIAGPLVVALVVEAAGLVATELNDVPVR